MNKKINIKDIVNEESLFVILQKTQNPSVNLIQNIFKKAKNKKGLTLLEASYLLNVKDKNLITEIFKIAGKIKAEIYGERLVFFAPLYISDFCINNCEYCNFHKINIELKRKKLSVKEIKEQTKVIINSGHKRILLECGEDPINNSINDVITAIKTIYAVKTKKGNIRRINVNVAATTLKNFKKLKSAKIGTYQLFQETYHYQTYKKLHHGPKANYERQITAYNRAFAAGIDDLGLGVLFGLYENWKFEVLALISHSQYLDKTYGIGPHTISVPRFQSAPTVNFKSKTKITDMDFLKIIAVLRLTVPYVGLILSTRENENLRKRAFKTGISQASAGSVAITGGYGKIKVGNQFQPQFELHDKRQLSEVISSILNDKLLPSFCTACYRKSRTGENFMKLSKPGNIHNFCRPNGILTFAEYLEDFAKQNGLYEKGHKIINYYLNQIENKMVKKQTEEKLKKIKYGKRDLYF